MVRKLGGPGNRSGEHEKADNPMPIKDTKPLIEIPAERAKDELIRSGGPPVIQAIKKKAKCRTPQLVYSNNCNFSKNLFTYINSLDFQIDIEYVNVDELIADLIRRKKKPILPYPYSEMEVTPSLFVFEEDEQIRLFEGEDIPEFIDDYIRERTKPLHFDPSKANSGDPRSFCEDWKNAGKGENLDQKIKEEEARRTALRKSIKY